MKGHRFRSPYLSTSRFKALKTERQWRFLACWTYGVKHPAHRHWPQPTLTPAHTIHVLAPP